MRLVFCGTPEFAVATLDALLRAGHDVRLVLSQPDRPVGRYAEIHPTPVKALALEHGLTVDQPEKIRNNLDLRDRLEAIAPEAIVVVAYGRILPPWMLDLPRHGCLNGHASLLPRWRGAAPIQWAIASGDKETGVTIMRLDEGLDTGPMLLRRSVPIGPTTTSPDLFVSLAHLGAELMVEALHNLEKGSVTAVPQDSSAATLAPILTREDGLVDWSKSALEIERRFRGFQPWPGLYTFLRGKKLQLHAMRLVASPPHGGTPVEPVAGSACETSEGVQVLCGDGRSVLLTQVQIEGRKRMPATDFLRGSSLFPGEMLGA